jgi:hypothetical protein
MPLNYQTPPNATTPVPAETTQNFYPNYYQQPRMTAAPIVYYPQQQQQPEQTERPLDQQLDSNRVGFSWEIGKYIFELYLERGIIRVLMEV